MRSCPRALAAAVAVALGAACAASAVQAQSYPNKPIRWVVPSAPGDGSDSTGRLIAERISRELGQPVIIDNKPGAGGVVGSEFAAKAAPDGYTMIVGNAGSHGINAGIYTKLNYDVVKDFVPVALFCTTPNVMVASPATAAKVKTVAEFVTFAKANPGKLNYASGGVGSSSHLSAELFKSMTGIDMTHVPYKGAAPAVTGVLGDEVQLMIGNLPPWSAHLKAGKAQALAVTTAKRHSSLPDVPALAESLPGFETVAWFGVLAPAGTPKAVVDRINLLVNQALEQDDVKARFATLACDPAPTTPEAFAARVTSDVARWKKLAAEKGIRAD
jgi:tripartite-type tricarboxylate transporter receptor subunit TctC